MTPRKFECELSVKGLRQLAKDLRYYKNTTLTDNVKEFVNELSDIGIKVANYNKGAFDEYITFTKDIVNTKYKYQCKAVIIGVNSKQNIAEWVTKGVVHQAEVNSIMMAEYGSGQYAFAGHRGTFPNQKHAFESTWYWVDLNGETHSSHGVRPAEPMYKAFMEMWSEIDTVARRCFTR